MGWKATDIPDQTGRVAVVTGGNGGLGLETTRQLADTDNRAQGPSAPLGDGAIVSPVPGSVALRARQVAMGQSVLRPSVLAGPRHRRLGPPRFG
jgi:NAD(P)-dependent dehydrogenase (short-subunit alcohol dehydrogenase family)